MSGTEVRRAEESTKKNVLLTEAQEDFRLAEEKSILLEATQAEFSIEKDDLKKQVEEYFGELEVSPEQKEKVSDEVYKFTMDCQFAYSALNYLGAMYDIEAENLGYQQLKDRQQKIGSEKAKLVELMRNPLGSRELVTDVSRANFLSQPQVFFDQRRNEINLERAEGDLPSGPTTGQINIAARMGSLTGKTTLFANWIEKVFNTKGRKKDEEFYKSWSHKLQNEIYEHMNGFWTNLLGGAETSREYAGTLQDEMYNQMIDDDEILNKIEVPSLFYYYRPINVEDQPKATIVGLEGELITCALQYLKSDDSTYLLCHRDAWYTQTEDGTRTYVYEQPEDLTSYTKDRVSCKYIKTDDGYRQSSASGKRVYDVSENHGLPTKLIGGEGDSCNIDKIIAQGEEISLEQSEARFAQIPSFLQRMGFSETDLESGKRLKELVSLAASNVYFDLVKDLHEGKRPAVLGLLGENIDFTDFNDALKNLDENLLDSYIANAITQYCQIHNVAWPEGQEMPGFDEAFEAALARVHNDSTIKNLAQEFSNTDNVLKNTTESVTVNEFLNVLTDPQLVDPEHRRICNSIAHKIYNGSNLGIMPGGRVEGYDLTSGEIDWTGGLQINDGEYTLSAQRLGDQLHVSISDNSVEVKPAPYATEGTKRYTRDLNIAQKVRETQEANIQSYSYLFSGKLFQNGLEIFSEQVNGHTSELGYTEDEGLRSQSLIREHRKTHPYRKTYTELVGTGKRNADVFEVGKNYDTAKLFAQELALFAASGGPAGRLAFATIRGLGKVIQTGNYLKKGMHFRQAVRFSHLSNKAIQSNTRMRLSHRTLTGLYFHPIVTTLKAGIDEEFREHRANEMTNTSRYIHSILTMHILGPIGGVTQAAQKTATSTLMKGSILTLGVGAEVGALLGLNHAFELALPEKYDINTADQSILEEIGHTLAMVIGLRLVHLPLKKPLDPGVKEKITITEINNGIPNGRIEIGEAVFLINKGNIEPLNRKSREMLSNEGAIDGVQAAKYSPLIQKVESLYQGQSKRRSASWEETADNLNPRMTESARRAKIKEEIIAEQRSKNPQEAQRLENLSEKERNDALDKFIEAHNIDQKTGEIINSEYGIEAQSKEALTGKTRKAQEGYDILGIEAGNTTRILFEKGLLGKYGFIFERTVAKAIKAKEFNNRAEAALFDTFQHDSVNTNKSSFDAKGIVSGYSKGSKKIAKHEYKSNVGNVSTSMNSAGDVLTVSYNVTSGGATTSKTITYKITRPDGSRSQASLIEYEGGGNFILGFKGKAKKQDLVDLQNYIEANKTDMLEITKDGTKVDSSHGLLAKSDLAIKPDQNGNKYLYEGIRVGGHGPTTPGKTHIAGNEMDIYGKSSGYSRNELYRMEVRREFNAEFAQHIESAGYYNSIHNAGQSHAGITPTTFQFRGMIHRVQYSYEPNAANPNAPYHSVKVDYQNIGGTSGLYKNSNQNPFILLRIYPKPL